MKNKKKTKKIIVISLIIVAILAINIFKSSQEEENDVNALAGFELLASTDFNKDEVLAMGYPTMLDIGGADCIPCKAMAPVLKELNSELMGKAIIKFVDYWKYSHLGNQFEFEVIPTQFFYDEDGKLFTTHQGGITKEEVLDTFKEMGYEFND